MKSDPLLSSNENYGVTGIAWTNMDSTCRIHYSVRLGGLSDQNIESELILKDYPLRYFSFLLGNMAKLSPLNHLLSFPQFNIHMFLTL